MIVVIGKIERLGEVQGVSLIHQEVANSDLDAVLSECFASTYGLEYLCCSGRTVSTLRTLSHLPLASFHPPSLQALFQSQSPAVVRSER